MIIAITIILSLLIICATIFTCKYLEGCIAFCLRHELAETKNNANNLEKQMDKILQELDELQAKIKEQNETYSNSNNN